MLSNKKQDTGSSLHGETIRETVISGIFERQSFKRIRDILAFIGDGLHVFVNLAPFYQQFFIGHICKQLNQGSAVDDIGFIFHPVDFNAVF
jgi:hypothetical protein